MNDFFKKRCLLLPVIRIACSSSYARYRKLKELSNEFNASFLFETNVGAGLPVIGTLTDLLRSGTMFRVLKQY
jgi:aspartokinase/homoserine dehydrogenase 1